MVKYSHTKLLEPSERHGLQKWLPLIVLSLALMIIVLDTTILNVSLKTIVTDLHTNLQGVQWVITAYALTLAALMITGGRMGDLYGRKKMFIIGAIIFAAGSFLTSISPNIGVMIAGESVIEGVGAALMMPATASLLLSHYRGRDRALAFGIWGGVAAAASALGPIVGGFLTTHYSWRWAFRINVFVVILLLIGSIVIDEARDRIEKAELDFVGVFLSAAGLLAFVYGIIESSTYGWWVAKQPYQVAGYELFGSHSVTPYAIGLGLILIGIFLWRENTTEAKGHTPLVSLNLFKNKQFTAGTTVNGLLALSQMGLIFALPVFLQSVKNLDAFHTGLALLPMSLTLLVAAPVSAVLSKRITPKRLIQAGLVINMLAVVFLRQTLTATTTVWALAPGMAVYGIGVGLVFAQVTNLTLSAVPVDEAGEASGVNNTFRQVGSSLGSAIIGAVLLSTLATQLASGIYKSQTIPYEAKRALSISVSAHASNVELGGIGQDQQTQTLPDNIRQELTVIAHEASAAASRKAILYTGLCTFVAFLAAFKLPNIKDVERGRPGAKTTH